MTKAKHGDVVKVHYSCFLEEGSLVETTMNAEPMQFTLGSGQVIHGFDEAVAGMREDETKTVRVMMDEAFGPHNDERVMMIQKERLPGDLCFEAGKKLQIPTGEGQKITAYVLDVTESTVTLDVNHPLSGKNLTFSIRLLEIAPRAE